MNTHSGKQVSERLLPALLPHDMEASGRCHPEEVPLPLSQVGVTLGRCPFPGVCRPKHSCCCLSLWDTSGCSPQGSIRAVSASVPSQGAHPHPEFMPGSWSHTQHLSPPIDVRAACPAPVLLTVPRTSWLPRHSLQPASLLLSYGEFHLVF